MGGHARVRGAVLHGVDGLIVEVEVDVSQGLPSVGVVGLPDAAVGEARHRVRCAIESSEFDWPMQRVTVNLTPADVRKSGSGLDLPIAMGILVATGQVPSAHVDETVFVGELGLDGRLCPSTGSLAIALAAQRMGFARVITPRRASGGLMRIPDVHVLEARTLREAATLVAGGVVGAAVQDSDDQELEDLAPRRTERDDLDEDFLDVRGHGDAVVAMTVAAAGGHHLSLVGPPGVGKSMLARRLPGILPDLTPDEAIHVAAIHGVAGLERHSYRPPVSMPHHSASAAALLGSVRGARVVPGAVTLAHRGCLIMDEAPEFSRPCLEGLRQPLESGEVSLQRTGWAGRLPADFQLLVTANPCPCGHRTGTGSRCRCTSMEIRRYAAKLSGPLMDRVDIRMHVSKPTRQALRGDVGQSSAELRDRVAEARDRAAARFRSESWRLNARIPVNALRSRWLPDEEGLALVEEWESRAWGLRGSDRILRLAWTLADLGSRSRPNADDVAAALCLRGPDSGEAGR